MVGLAGSALARIRVGSARSVQHGSEAATGLALRQLAALCRSRLGGWCVESGCGRRVSEALLCHA